MATATRHLQMIPYKGYTGVFEFDAELRIFTGLVVDLRDEICFEGDSFESLEASMHRAVDHYLRVCESRGEEPERAISRRLDLRPGPELRDAESKTEARRQADAVAHSEQEPDDQIFVDSISEGEITTAELYSPERRAEYILSNAIDDDDYARAREEVQRSGLDPDSIPHRRPRGPKPGQ